MNLKNQKKTGSDLDTIIRTARRSDIDFIIKGIIEAERGGRQIIPTQAIFDISLVELKSNLKRFLEDEELLDCEYALNSYLIAEIDGVAAALQSHWIEGSHGIESNLIKINCWLSVLDTEKIQNIKPILTIANKYSLTRLNNYLQLENVYVSPDYRNRGLAIKLMKTSFINAFKQNSNCPGCQIALFKENIKSYNHLKERGFKINQSIKIQNDALNIIFDHNTRISMTLETQKMQSVIKRY